MPKVQNFKFHNAFNNFGRDTFQEYTWILGSKSGVILSEEMSFETFIPTRPHVNENEEKLAKIQNFTILWTSLAETSTTRMHDFLGVNLMCTFIGDVVWNFNSHMVPC